MTGLLPEFATSIKGWPKATAKRRLASLTDASTTASSPQKVDDSQPATSPFIRGFSPPLTEAKHRLLEALHWDAQCPLDRVQR